MIVLDLPPLPENVTVECICGWGFNVTWQIVVGNSAVPHPDVYTIRILMHDINNSTSSLKPLAYSTKQRHFEFKKADICTSESTIYIVEVQSQNSTFNSRSHFVRASWRKSGTVQEKFFYYIYTHFFSSEHSKRNFKKFFLTKPPEIQVRLIKTTCSCSLSVRYHLAAASFNLSLFESRNQFLRNISVRSFLTFLEISPRVTY